MSERIHSDLPDFNIFIQHRLKLMLSEFDGTRASFAEKASISASSLTRYLNGHCKLNSPIAKSMLSFVSKDKAEYRTLLAHYFPKEAKIYQKVYVETDSEVVKLNVLDFIEKDGIYYHVFAHSGLDYGLPLETLDKTWGKDGMRRAQEMIKCGLISLEEKRVVRENKMASYGCLDAVKMAASYVVDGFPLENIYKKEGGMAVLTNNLNDKGVAAQRELYLKHAAEMMELLNDPENKGTIPVAYCVVTGKTLCSEDYQEDVKEIVEDEEKKNEK